MHTPYGQVVLLTGASSGIGRAIAQGLAEEGFKVYGTSRSPVTDDKIIKNDKGKGFIKFIKLDVCDEDSVKKAVDFVVEAEGRIDILINNAGIAIAGPIEETKPQEALKQFDTNFFGSLRMCRAVLPVMRKQNNGLIIIIGSVMGLISVPFQAMYGASKYALEAFNEALRIEVKPFGIKSVIIEPGDIKTDITNNRYFCEETANSSYGNRFTDSLEKMAHDEQNGPSPDVVVKAVLKLVQRKNPPVRITVGFTYKVFVLLKRLLPSRLVEYILEKMYA